ncbi:UDP-D-xylose:ribitol-5-phosphate beta1,4-xylosyltransferase [Hondaea fermentalgiana]|uniref:UDP-D-xylose:ribitol-5-phosphate beta1,4-xylosyltransferase n=1 Tax=Hondaea fermentalgiana TaxID=2315210 RepID=A0A2R5GQF7_9STRA|nr:UDP-D-xylose:ribitol-5-phosphate beta1,4-xylosyltransferase [Hondaea fermentalgiana]|eukprot:GBG30863.1 UDP-D-xylose:ribitol-5-phosphate beta1,4-xylosyltransferase [Hondaea fermentalgiana]
MLIVAAVMALVVLGFVGHRGQQEHVAGGEALIVGEASSEANSNVQTAETRTSPMLRPGSQVPDTTFDEHEDPHVPETENFFEENSDEEEQQKETETVDEQQQEEEEQQPEAGKFSHLQKPVAVPNANAKVKVIKVCVQGPNPRVSSLFVRNGLGIFGSQLEFVMAPMLRDQLSQFVASGAIRAAAVPAAETCDPSWPRLNLAFQKGLTARTLATPGQTTFVVGDEYCKCPSDLCGGTSPKVPMRQYHSTSLSSGYLPLGARFEFEPVSSDEIVVAAARTHVYNFAGALTSTSRKQLNAILENAKNNPASPLSRGFVNVAPAWKKDAMADTYVSPTAYRAALLDSMFTLCPAGTNPEAFRIYEV